MLIQRFAAIMTVAAMLACNTRNAPEESGSSNTSQPAPPQPEEPTTSISVDSTGTRVKTKEVEVNVGRDSAGLKIGDPK